MISIYSVNSNGKFDNREITRYGLVILENREGFFHCGLDLERKGSAEWLSALTGQKTAGSLKTTILNVFCFFLFAWHIIFVVATSGSAINWSTCCKKWSILNGLTIKSFQQTVASTSCLAWCADMINTGTPTVCSFLRSCRQLSNPLPSEAGYPVWTCPANDDQPLRWNGSRCRTARHLACVIRCSHMATSF